MEVENETLIYSQESMMAFDGPFRELAWYKKMALIPIWILMCPLIFIVTLFLILPVGTFAVLHNFTGELLYHLTDTVSVGCGPMCPPAW